MNKVSLNGILLSATFRNTRSFSIGRWYCSSTSTTQSQFLSYDKDPGPAFIRQDVQKLLRSMTRLELDKVFRKRAVKNNTVEYRFMTDEQLREEVKKSIGRAEKLLQMPPIVAAMKENPQVISRDPALSGFSDTKMVFTDISFGLRNNKRTIVERLTDGTLQEASYETKKRLNQIYFPLKGRKIRTPKMFDSAELNKILDSGEYEFVLNKACVQFEPFEKEYHDITSAVFQHVNENKAFDVLRSTRHFGPMCFFLVWQRLVDDLLLDMIKRNYMRNAVELVFLHCTLHDVSVDAEGSEQLKEHILSTEAPIIESNKRTVQELEQDEKFLSLVERFVLQHCVKKVQLNLAIAANREMINDRIKLAEGIRKMHGER
ncbi:28S ribosomal protein S22, mitochondrial [Wyeomyia smithii]|uniref:28S ribosomal protein S22, mitochondrial n=1 Tax=Wyeomyia smithii TaxID=174621 RepID=UPI0024680C02|nr:28S ribosomal protein S22, mitochondrial [Wyeomyia smithii]